MDLDAHVRVFCKAIQANGEKNDDDIINLFCFTFRDAMYQREKNFMRVHLVYKFEE
jgi:hypothetical protein